MPGGHHENMRGWTPEEDGRLLELIEESGKRWKLIAEALGPGNPRTPAMVRNRYLRIERGRWLTNNGMSKNRCGQCGQLKRGHVCEAPRALVSTSYEAQEARHRESRLLTDGSVAGGASPQVGQHLGLAFLDSAIDSSGVMSRLAETTHPSPKYAEGRAAGPPGFSGQGQQGGGTSSAPPLTTQGSMEILVMAAISRDSSGAAEELREETELSGQDVEGGSLLSLC